MSDSLRSHELQHTRPPCPSPTPGVYSNSCPSSWWCHPTISSSVIPFSSCPASGSFQMSQLFSSGGQSLGVSGSTLVFSMNTQDWSPFQWTGWISWLSKGLQHHSSKASILRCSAFFILQRLHPYMTTRKTIALARTMVNIFGFLGHTQLCDCSMKETIHHKQIEGCGWVPIQLY